MKKILAFLLGFCLFLCLLSGCGTTPAEGENTTPDGEATGEDTAPDISATARELVSKLQVTSSYTREGKTSNEEMVMNYTWTATGAVMEGYEQDSNGKDTARLEITFDDQKRPATMVRYSDPADEEPEESKVTFDYSVEGRVKLINDGFGDGEQYVIYDYDENGRMIREEYPTYTRTYEYDEKGNCTRKYIDNKSEESQDSEYKTVYTYDETGKAIYAEQTYSATGAETQIHYSYYPNGNVMWAFEVSGQGDVNVLQHPYNTKDIGWGMGRMMSESFSDYQVEKDAQGRIVKVTATSPYDGSVKESTFAYDDQGRLVRHKSHYDTVTQWEYNAGGYLVKETKENENGDVTTTTYTYDDKGRMTEEKCTGPEGTGHIYTRAYNDEGMTTKMVEENVYYDSTSTTTAVIEYTTNAECQVSDAWAALFLNFFTVGV